MGEYYVYILLDTTKPGYFSYKSANGDGEYTFLYEPFYVGYGKNQRYFDHFLINTKRGSSHNIRKVDRIKSILSKTGENPGLRVTSWYLTEEAALSLEINVIKSIGREIDGGVLLNIQPGGKTSDTLSNHPDKIKICEKISKSKIGRNYIDLVGEEAANSWKEKLKKAQADWWLNATEEEKEERISKYKRGKDHIHYKKSIPGHKHTKESILKISNSRLGSKNINAKLYLLENESGESIKTDNIREFAKSKNINVANLYYACRKQITHNGWKVIDLGYINKLD